MTFLRYYFIALCFVLAGCVNGAEIPPPAGQNIVTVVGAIHGQHKRSERYSLEILQKAIREFKPDIIMVELPPDRFETAFDNFKQFGEVRESRADDFPELVDVVFPLRAELDFEMIPVAAWTQDIADNRRATEQRIKADPVRASDWASYQTAIKAYGQGVAGRSDDPAFIHSTAYDQAVKARQQTYDMLFGADLGAGGWKAINAAHISKMNTALDGIKGQEKRVLILFGAWHKYKILEALEPRDDIQIVDAATLFSD